MHYKIKYINPTRQYLTIHAEFECNESNELLVQFPAWRPGRYELGNFAKNIKNFKAKNELNQLLTAKKVSKDQWKIDSKDSTKIVLSYQYYANEINAGSSYIDENQLYVNPINCLAYIPSKQDETCSLKIEVPSHYKIACGAAINNNIITCNSYHELVDSPFIASPDLQHKTYEILGINFHLWFNGISEINWDRLIQDFEKFTLKQIEVFSNRRERILGFPNKDYHFLFQILPYKAYHGVEHTTSTVIALGPESEIFNEKYDDLLGVSSHELYHVWNIKSIRPIEMYPYDYSKENYSYLGYVAEGVTTYLGDVFLALSGVKEFGWYKKEFEKLLQKHFDNFGRFNYSVAQSSWDTWLDGYVKGAPERKVSIYNEGALLAFIVDMKIRSASNNKASIHNVMYDLYHDFALKNKGYSESDYIGLCEKYGGCSFSDLFKNQIHGTQPYESVLVEALETIGFNLEMELNPNNAERILGIKSVEQDNRCIITDIYPGSSADLSALIIGDEIRSVNEKSIANSLNETLEEFKDNPLHLKINRHGAELEIMCPNTNRAMYPIYKIVKKKVPSNLNKRIFKSWIGYPLDDQH